MKQIGKVKYNGKEYPVYQDGGEKKYQSGNIPPIISLPEVEVAEQPSWKIDRENLTADKINWWESFNFKKWGLNDYSDFSSFNSAFRNARESKEDEFVWKGKRFSTELAPKEVSERYFDSKKFLEDYYTTEPFFRPDTSAIGKLEAWKKYTTDKYGTNWSDYYKKVKDLPNTFRYGSPQLDTLDMLSQPLYYKDFPEEAKVHYEKTIRDKYIQGLNDPSYYFSITSQPDPENPVLGYQDAKEKRLYVSNVEPTSEKFNTTSVHELSHKADTEDRLSYYYSGSSQRIPKVDVEKVNAFGSALSQDRFDYITDPTETEARKMSTLYYMNKALGKNIKSGQIKQSDLDELYELMNQSGGYASENTVLPNDILDILELYKYQQEDLLKYLNNDFSYSEKKQKGGETPTDYFEQPPLYPSDFEFTMDRNRGQARYFTNPITHEPFPLVNLPDAEVVAERTPHGQLSNESLLAGVTSAKPWFEAGNYEMGQRVLNERLEDLNRASMAYEFTSIPGMVRTTDRIQNDPADLFTGTGALDALSFIPTVALGSKDFKALEKVIQPSVRKLLVKIDDTIKPKNDWQYDEIFNMDTDELNQSFIDDINSTDDFIQEQGENIIREISSPEGIKRLENFIRQTDPNLTDEQVSYIVGARLSELTTAYKKNRINSEIKPLIEALKNENTESIYKELITKELLRKILDVYPKDNAHFSWVNTSLDVKSISPPKDLFPDLYKPINELNKLGPTEKIKFQNGIADPMFDPGTITLGRNYKNSLNTLEHELIGHGLQRKNNTILDEELIETLEPKTIVDNIYNKWALPFSKEHLDYFNNPSRREPLAFAVEQRQALRNMGIIKNRYDKITPKMLLEARFKSSFKDPQKTGNRLSRITPPWKYKEIADIMNKIPGLTVPIAVGAGASSQKDLGRVEFKEGGPIVDPMGQYNHPGEPTLVPTPSGYITMKGIKYPVYAVDNTGHSKVMQPDGEYKFPGNMVMEYPMMQDGGQKFSRLSQRHQPLDYRNVYTPTREQRDNIPQTNIEQRQIDKTTGLPAGSENKIPSTETNLWINDVVESAKDLKAMGQYWWEKNIGSSEEKTDDIKIEKIEEKKIETLPKPKVKLIEQPKVEEKTKIEYPQFVQRTAFDNDRDYGNANNIFWGYRNQFNNENGFVYNIIPRKEIIEKTGNTKIPNSLGVAHFFIESDLYDDKKSQQTINKINDNLNQNNHVAIYKKINDNQVELKYVNNINDYNNYLKNGYKAAAPLREIKAVDIDWNKTSRPYHSVQDGEKDGWSRTGKKGNMFGKGIENILTKDGKDTWLVYKAAHGRDGKLGRFNGNSLVFLIEAPDGQKIVRDFSGTIQQIQDEINNIEKEFNIGQERITLGFFDAGSYSAKPAATNDNYIDYKSYSSFNPDKKSGAGIAIPVQNQNQSKMQKGGLVKMRKGSRPNSDGTHSTHLMAHEYIPQIGWVVFPTLFQNPDGTWIDYSNESDLRIPIREAFNRGEIKHFGEDMESAAKFAHGSWKK